MQRRCWRRTCRANIPIRRKNRMARGRTTLRSRLARLLEPRAPHPKLRLAAVKELREAGLQVGVSASPLLPGITDGEGELEAVAAAAKEAGAQWFFSGVLFLMPSSAKQF